MKKDSDKAESVLLGPEPLSLMVQSLNNLQMPPEMLSPLATVNPIGENQQIVTVSFGLENFIINKMIPQIFRLKIT